jgi:hypothetical protein
MDGRPTQGFEGTTRQEVANPEDLISLQKRMGENRKGPALLESFESWGRDAVGRSTHDPAREMRKLKSSDHSINLSPVKTGYLDNCRSGATLSGLGDDFVSGARGYRWMLCFPIWKPA